MSVPDEAYSRNAPCALNLISTLLLHTINNVYERMFILLHEKKKGGVIKKGHFDLQQAIQDYSQLTIVRKMLLQVVFSARIL